MSCHTWAYEAIKQEQLPEVREDIKERLQKSFQYVPDGVRIEDKINEVYEQVKKTYGEDFYTFDELSDTIKTGNARIHDYLKRIEEEPENTEVLFEAYQFFGGCEYKYHNGMLYTECGFDEPVRIYGYPEDTFTDAEAFIKWIKESEEADGHPISEYYLYDIDGTERKVVGYTPEMEILIRNFWKRHDDKVYVEFG